MRVKVKYHDVLAETEKAILFLISESEIWFPKSKITIRVGFFTCPEWLAQKKQVKYKKYIHIPEKIEPIYEQSAIPELEYNPDRGI